MTYTAEEAWKIAYLLRAVRRPPLTYSVATVKPAGAGEQKAEVAESARDTVVTAG